MLGGIRKWALTLYIPTVVVIFCSIPPIVVVFQLALLDEGMHGVTKLDSNYVSELLSRFSGREVARAFGLAPPDPYAVRTMSGCTCQLPFEFGKRADGSMKIRHNCTNTGAAVSDKQGRPSLWCDTGPFCGRPYHHSDRPHTNRDCCYDVCVDASGITIEGAAM